MLIEVLKSKIGHASITQAELHYEGSITIDADVLKAAGTSFPGEKVHVLNESTGSRLGKSTRLRAIRVPALFVSTGPAARLGLVGEPCESF